MNGDRSNYWAAGDPIDLVGRLTQYHDHWDLSGTHPIVTSWVRNTVAYYSTVLDVSSWDSALSFEGEQGELIRMAVPQARTLISEMATLITKSKLAYNAVAQAQGSDIIQATRLGNALSNQIVDEQNLDSLNYYMVETGLVMGAAFTHAQWRTDKGTPRMSDESERLVYDGDLEISFKNPYEVYYDYSHTKWSDITWCEVREKRNRYDLIAEYPELEREILLLPSVKDVKTIQAYYHRMVNEDDLVYTYKFYTRPSPALPEGRLTFYGSPECIFFDGPNSYQTIPVTPFMPEKVQNTLLGYPVLSDLLPLQEMLDHSFSAIATNQSALAVQSVTVPDGSNLNVQDIYGMNFISYTPQNVPGGGRPEPMQLTQSAPETFKFIDVCEAHLEKVSKVNSALRGTPPPGVTSGVAIATLHASALEFLTSGFKAYKYTMEETMLHAINAYRRFASTPHVVQITGKQKQPKVEEFIGTDLDPIKSVRLPITNPLLQTVAGRTDIAEKLVQSGLVTQAQDYISILEGAPIEQLYETELAENDRIQEENEMLAMGDKPMALFTDDHAAHIRKHSTLLNDKANREDGMYTEQILQHIMDHVRLAKEADPFLTAMIRTGRMPEMPPAEQAPPDSDMPPVPGEAGQSAVAPQPEMGSSAVGPEGEPALPAQDLLRRS